MRGVKCKYTENMQNEISQILKMREMKCAHTENMQKEICRILRIGGIRNVFPDCWYNAYTELHGY
jgi:hypothetical protein